MNPDIHLLTGAYSVDALDEFERRQFEAHLAQCPDCAHEVAELRATAALLATAVGERPPDALLARVLAQITRTRQGSPIGSHRRERGSTRFGSDNRWLVRLTTVAAAVAIAVAIALGGLAVHTGHQLAGAQAELAHDQTLSQMLAAPDARVGTGSNAAGASGLVVFSHDLNQAVLVANRMPAAPAGWAYQAWLLGIGNPRSAGLLSPGPDSTMAPLAFSGLTGASMIGITVEPAGGSLQPTSNPVLIVDLPA